MMILRALLIVAVVGVHSLSWADDRCSPIDLRDSLGPIRNQLGTSWCYANSAADMVTQALGVRVSAFDLAITYLTEDENQLRTSRNRHIQAYLR